MVLLFTSHFSIDRAILYWRVEFLMDFCICAISTQHFTQSAPTMKNTDYETVTRPYRIVSCCVQEKSINPKFNHSQDWDLVVDDELVQYLASDVLELEVARLIDLLMDA